MKSTGIYRKVDELGRIVVPIELRNKLGIEVKDSLEVFIDGSSIVLKKVESNCAFCGSTKKLINFNDKQICSKCLEKIKKLDN